MIKVYRSKYYMSLTVIVGERYIDFTGGTTSPRRINGEYVTGDPKLQAMLERHPDFNKDFELVRTFDPDPAPVVAEEEPVADTPAKTISKAKNSQEAKEELNKKYKISYSQLKNSDMILSAAERFGIVYPNWER
jgi:hypothetical protein